MKAHPCELTFHRTTDEEFADCCVWGGWIETWEFCHVVDCKEPVPHIHYICKNGHVDFAEKDTCFWCWHKSELYEVRHMILKFKKDYGKSLLRSGMCLVVFLTYTIANMGVR